MNRNQRRILLSDAMREERSNSKVVLFGAWALALIVLATVVYKIGMA